MDVSILSGIRVIDCGTYIAGPAAATVMSDFGAEVIKIERPPHGDPYRYLSLVPLMPQSDLHYCWILDGRNKKSLALNLHDPAAQEVLRKLVSTADVFITNYQPRLVEKFRLGYEQLAGVNRRLIYALVTGYGECGPDVNQPGYDATAYWARSGLMDLMHYADADPCQSVAGLGDHPASMAVFGAIMLALYRRERTGRGGKVSTSLMANGAWSNSCQIQAELVKAQWPPRWTRKTTLNPLVNHYVTRDRRRFMLCCLEPMRDWPNLCRALGRPDLIEDSRFDAPAARTAHGSELVEILDAEIAKRDMAEWARLLAEHEVIYGLVPAMEQVACDPQMEANGVFVDLADAPLRTVASPIRLEGVEKVRPRLAPEVGQHTLEILQSLGYDAERIEGLLATGAAMAAGIGASR